MTTLDERLAELRRRSVPSGPSVDGLRRRIRRRRVRRLAGAGAGAAMAALAVVLGGLVAGPRDDSRTVTVVDDPTESTSTTMSETPALPAEAVGVDRDGELVVFGVPSGDVVRTLYDGGLGDGAPLIDAVDVDSEGSWVYFSTVDHGGELFRVPLEGGDVELLGPGSSPQVSNDGRYLAYSGPRQSLPATIVVRELSTGEERRWSVDSDDPDFFHYNGRISDITWSPDDTRLAYVSAYEGSEVRVLDLDAGSLSASEPIDRITTHPAWLSDTELLGVRECCYPFERDQLEPVVIIVVDTATGATTELGEVVGVWALDVTADRRHALVGSTGVDVSELSLHTVEDLLGGGTAVPGGYRSVAWVP